MNLTHSFSVRHRLRHHWARGIILLLLLLLPLLAAAVAFATQFQVAEAFGGKQHHQSQGDNQGNGNNNQNNGNDNNQGNNNNAQQQQQQAAVVTCTLTVPQNPLTAQGLAQPYILSGPGAQTGNGNNNNLGNGNNNNQQGGNNNNNQGGQQGNGNNNNQGGQQTGCTEANMATAAFVQAAILNPATGQISVYNPLVVDTQHPQPAIPPAVPQLPQGAVVGIWFGFNGNNLLLQGTNGSLQQANCVSGFQGSNFGQVSYCNAPAFFAAANQAQLQIPSIGTAVDGKPCPTVRSFDLVDQDQSDNVPATYLATPQGTIAQNTPGNQQQLTNAVKLANGSDEGLAANILLPALGCTSWKGVDLAAAAQGAQMMSPDVALNELQAAKYQQPPAAVVPISDPMTVVMNNQGGQQGNGNNNNQGGQQGNGNNNNQQNNVNIQASIDKTDAYRAGVDQPPIQNVADAGSAPYCQALLQVGVPRLAEPQFKTLTQGLPSPSPAMANNLYTFLGQRLATTLGSNGGLVPSCLQTLNIQNPVQVQTDGNGVATSVQFNTNIQQGNNQQNNGNNNNQGNQCNQQNNANNQGNNNQQANANDQGNQQNNGNNNNQGNQCNQQNNANNQGNNNNQGNQQNNANDQGNQQNNGNNNNQGNQCNQQNNANNQDNNNDQNNNANNQGDSNNQGNQQNNGNNNNQENQQCNQQNN